MKASKRPPLDFTANEAGLTAQAQAAEPPPVAEPQAEAPLAAPQMAEPAGSPPVAAAEPMTPVLFGRRPAPAKEAQGWPIYVAALVVSVLWAAAPLAFAVGYREGVSPLQYDPFALAVFGLMAVGPVALVWIAAYALRQGMKLSAEIRHTRELAHRMLEPAALAAAEAGGAVLAVQRQIDTAAASAAEAREVMTTLRAALAEETERLAEAAAASARTAADLTRSLGGERTELVALSGQLDAQSAAIADAITRQARMVAEASDLAETQLREAEATLAARAADLAAAAGEASDAARVAGEDLARQVARLETAGTGVGEQMRAVEDALTEQRGALVTIAHALRSDQEDFAAQAESRSAQLGEFVAHARMSAAEVGDASAAGAEALSQLITASVEQLQGLLEAARLQRESVAADAADTIGRVVEAAAGQRDALEADLRGSIDRLAEAAEEARRTAEGHAEAARLRVDQLTETAFSAHQKADHIFEARLNDARDLIERSAQMVEQAGARTAEKLEEGVTAARATLAELDRMVSEVAERAEQMPVEAERRVGEVKAAALQSMDDLLSATRHAAEETQAIDAAFQDRVRRNYDMLSEAVRLMGVVSGAAPTVAQAMSGPAFRMPRLDDRPKPAEPAPSAEEAGLRPRLRLTPTATDEEFRSVFETAGGKAAPAADTPEGWTWKDLLGSLDDGADTEGLSERMVQEITGMGIDPAALLPKAKIDEIAAAVQTRDVAGAREVVRKLAPAAIRRLVRRLFSDAALRGQTERYLRRFGGMLEEAAERDREGFLVGALLSSEGGRAFLLLDAAAGDLT